MILDKVLNETASRYAAREDVRRDTREKLKRGGVVAANDPAMLAGRVTGMMVRGQTGAVADETMARDLIANILPMLTPGARGLVNPPGQKPPVNLTLERLIGKSDLRAVAYLNLGERAAASVARVQMFSGPFTHAGSGTGFMVSPRLLLTNNHVLGDGVTAGFSRAEFNFQADIDGQALPSYVFDLQPDQFFLTDEALDFTLVAVATVARDGTTPLGRFRWLPLVADPSKVLLGEPLNIVQHPNGEPKQLALRANELIDILDDFLHYYTDTAPGSSGSPVFNEEWEVVALHHSGVPARDANGNILSVDEALWLPEMGEQRIKWIANEGARVSRILDMVRSQQFEGDQAAFAAELLAAKFPPSHPASGSSTDGGGQSTGLGFTAAGSPAGGPTGGMGGSKLGAFFNQAGGQASVQPAEVSVDAAASGASITLTIPLQITINLGQAAMGGAAAGGAAMGGAAAGGAAMSGAGKLAGAMSARPAELQAALQEAAAAAERVYYDETQDRLDCETYYAGLAPDLDPAGMFAAVSDLVTRTHKQKPHYRPSVEVYPWVDLQPDLKIRSLYSNQVFEPSDLIEQDFAVEAQRQTRLNEIFREAAGDPAAAQEALLALEAALPYNCEHVVCQSWFAKKEPMRGDVHHLFACESGCNSFRGNTPYFDFPDFMEAVRDECGKREGTQGTAAEDKNAHFEPGNGKGAAARAVLYFLLRYPGVLNGLMPIYDAERLQMIVGWNKANPVSPWELHRNQAIFARQGNRNPLIDHPEWVDKIDFGKGL